jgi:hypothetical protein
VFGVRFELPLKDFDPSGNSYRTPNTEHRKLERSDMSLNTTEQAGLAMIDPLTATGTNQATALPLGPHRLAVHVTSVPSGTGVLLPSPRPGALVLVRNDDSANALAVYPPPGGTINGGSANAAYSLAAGASAAFLCWGTNWTT